jgi:hypothetical protein
MTHLGAGGRNPGQRLAGDYPAPPARIKTRAAWGGDGLALGWQTWLRPDPGRLVRPVKQFGG